ncbi:MAG TPA: hypothetical protein VLM79_28660, partial [Kofleriaceae bacterium]|nr:hypothetical protein [Kofleriaceae bacterium]
QPRRSLTPLTQIVGDFLTGPRHRCVGHSQEWTLYWPSSVHPVLLCSVHRLPAVCNLASQADAQVLHLAASPGDVIVGLSSKMQLQHGALAASEGGAALLDDLENSGVDPRPTPGGIIVEVR